jgi:hypothetical protein
MCYCSNCSLEFTVLFEDLRKHLKPAYAGKTVMAAILLVLASCAAGIGQMVSPSIDHDGEPFSYPSKPTDEIGVMYAPSAAEITPEGYVYTGFGELMFFVGSQLEPVNQRLHVLEKGYLPIVQYAVERGGITYHFEMFSASMGDQQPDGPVVNFVRVTAVNSGTSPRLASFATAIRYQGPSSTASGSADNRFIRPAAATAPGLYQQPGVEFNPDWIYGFSDNAFVRDDKVLYLFPMEPNPHLDLTLEDYYSNVTSIGSRKLKVGTTTPTGTATYRFLLQPGQSQREDFAMPLLPVADHDPLIAKIRAASYDTYRSAVAKYWEDVLAQGMSIDLPEKKVTDTFNASLVYDLLALNKIGDDYVQTVNQFHYHRFYLRDSADIARMYELTGYPEIAAQVLAFSIKKQEPDGNYLSQPGQYDGWGQTLWILGEHYRFTHDRQFAESVFPRMMHALDWFEKATAADPMHIMPATDVKDNEYVPGHLTGYNFLALDGLDNAVYVARSLNKPQELKRIENDRTAFRKNFTIVFDRLTANTHGYIPPDLDGNNLGTDWGNLLAITPRPQLSFDDPRIMGTLKAVRAKYQEGITTYTRPDQGQYLHHYLMIKNTLTSITINDQENAVRELYAELLHTSSTQAGFEYAIRPWGDRDFRGNLSPHGWFAAEYRSMLRSMLVRETDTDLHLLSVISPAWTGAGRQLRVQNVPTYFGKISLTLAMPNDTEADLSLQTNYRDAPKQLILHLPWFYTLDSAEADGKALKISNGELHLPIHTNRVILHWHRRAEGEQLSYDTAVSNYKREYRQRYEEWITTGKSYDWRPHSAEISKTGGE